jgi:5-formyltetrahydrofolate cyclo-ligase
MLPGAAGPKPGPSDPVPGHSGAAGQASQATPETPGPAVSPRTPAISATPDAAARDHRSTHETSSASSVSFAPEPVASAKTALRRQLVARRRALTEAGRAAAGRSLRDAVLGMPETQMAGTVAAYCSVGSEPGTRGLLFALWKRGSYVLLPVLLPDGDLDWASYEGPESLAAGPRGLLEPGPAEPRRGTGAVARADLVIVPALAADRRGNRLGKGGGSYDRALARVGPLVPTVALLFDGELLDEIPAAPHDVRVRLVAQPRDGIIRLP